MVKENDIIETEFLRFKVTKKEGKKTFDIEVRNINSNKLLGLINFRGAWRTYVFAPKQNTIFDSKCLQDIVWFGDLVTLEWRKSVKARNRKED